MKRKKDYKDMEKFVAYRNRSKNKYYRNRNYSYDKKRRWTDEEIQIVMEHKITDTEIAKLLKRSVCAVQDKRNKERNRINGK